MQATLQKYGITAIWHFTDRKNIQSIEENGGLLSLAESRRRGVKIQTPGGNDWSHEADAISGVDEFVHLAFINNHPMLFRAKEDGRITEPIWLKISTAALACAEVRYTMDVSNKKGVPLMTAQEAIESLDFEVLFMRTDWSKPEIQGRRKIALKSEILIPNQVSEKMILSCQNG